MSPGADSTDKEDARRTGDLQSAGDGGAMEARFSYLCKSGLALDDATAEESIALFGESKQILLGILPSDGSGSAVEKSWSAFILYCVSGLCTEKKNKEKDEGRVKLFHILEAAKLNALDFLKEMPHFALKADNILSSHYGSDWEKRIGELHANVDQLCWLSRFYKKAYYQFFKASGKCSWRNLSGPDDYVSDYHYFGWLLFLALRAHAFSRFKDLVTSTNALVSILTPPRAVRRAIYPLAAGRSGLLNMTQDLFDQIRLASPSPTEKKSVGDGDLSLLLWVLTSLYREQGTGPLPPRTMPGAILILHVPIGLRNLTISSSPFLDKKSEKGVDLLASLSQTYNASEEELKSMMEKVNKLIVDVLRKNPCHTSEYKTESLHDINTDELTYFKDLQDEKALQNDLLVLDKHYNDTIKCDADLDERMFLNVEEILDVNGSLNFSGDAINIFREPDNLGSVISPTKFIRNRVSPHPTASPVNGNFAGNLRMAQWTPVSTTMTTAKWLREVISPFPSIPSSDLQHFLISCDIHLTSSITHRANIILEAIFLSQFGERRIPGNLQGSNPMDSVWSEQRKLESAKLYYRVLEAICKAESQRLSGNNLTSLLSNERFHRCMLACAAELVLATHKTVTMMFPAVLERTGITAFDLSKVIESFVRHEETLPRELKRHLNFLEERLIESMSWGRGSSLYNSLVVARPALAAEINRLGLLAEPMPSLDSIVVHKSIISAGIQPASSRQTGDSRSPKRLCGENRALSADQNILTSPVKENTMIFNSPKSKLPSLQSAFASPACPNPSTSGESCAEAGLSCFFNKIWNADLTFRAIIYNYKKQPQCRSQVYKSVYVNWSSIDSMKKGHEHVDIVTFYNAVFIPCVKPLLEELGPDKVESGIPASPRLSTFPNLPDMSPKKVSACHNVYVSPLRQSKLDALLAPSSKSYYACVGESTHAFQSPSKDLMVINSRLNCGGGRRIGGRLNFDLVSDSIVAGSLGPQNGSSGSSAAGTAIDGHVKTEHPDM
ncbi:Retinoblastoma-related protein [Platanthera guangdongensis]|uniref:Retinoblastoma-related protein n=1 Tax=Platanthera guangdongensis TaxID=2320717 RepID=A0ABR2N292_9ASPA